MSGFLVAVVVMAVSQLRRLGHVGWLGAASSGVMAVAMAALAWKLLLLEPSPPAGAHTQLVQKHHPVAALVGLLDIFFVFRCVCVCVCVSAAVITNVGATMCVCWSASFTVHG
jgi:hypothetical protein